jgi:hypothetical protein
MVGCEYWFKVNKTFKEFVESGRCCTGLLIEVLFNEKPKRYLIGDVNMFGSIANGGMPFPENAIVIRYQIIWAR